jgi:hypothetical protein
VRQPLAEAFVDLFADEFVLRDLTVLEPMRSREEAKQYMQGWFTAFPDMQGRTTNRVLGEDSIAAEVEFTATNTGPLATNPPPRSTRSSSARSSTSCAGSPRTA